MKRTTSAIALVLLAMACKDSYNISDPPSELTLDTELRQTIGGWGTVPLLPVAKQDPAMVELGRSLFFDKILSGNRDVSCKISVMARPCSSRTCRDSFGSAGTKLKDIAPSAAETASAGF